MAREMTREEVQDAFLQYVHTCVREWETSTRTQDVRRKLEGLAFSILVALDGESVLPGFIVAPMPCKEDREYHIAHGEDWYPDNKVSAVVCDIAGDLHDRFYKVGGR